MVQRAKKRIVIVLWEGQRTMLGNGSGNLLLDLQLGLGNSLSKTLHLEFCCPGVPIAVQQNIERPRYLPQGIPRCQRDARVQISLCHLHVDGHNFLNLPFQVLFLLRPLALLRRNIMVQFSNLLGAVRAPKRRFEAVDQYPHNA